MLSLHDSVAFSGLASCGNYYDSLECIIKHWQVLYFVFTFELSEQLFHKEAHALQMNSMALLKIAVYSTSIFAQSWQRLTVECLKDE